MLDYYSLIKTYLVKMEHYSIIEIYKHDYESNNYLVVYDEVEKEYFQSMEEIENYISRLEETGELLGKEELLPKDNERVIEDD